MSVEIPYNEAFEKALIVAVLSDPMLMPQLSTIVHSEDFFRDVHRDIWKSMEHLEVEHIDSLAIEDKLTGNTKEYFKNLVANSERLLPSASNTLYYAETVRDKARLRAGINLGQQIAAICYKPNMEADEAIQELEEMFSSFLQKRVIENKGEDTREAFKKFTETLGQRVDTFEGIKTGFIQLDLMLHKLEGLVVLAARPSMGKTAFAINIARNVAQTNPVLFFSVEQSQEQIFERMLACEAEVPLEDIRTGAYLADDTAVDAIESANTRLLSIFEQMHVDEQSEIPASYISSVARQKKLEWGQIGLIVVDYLHILKLNNKQTVEALGDASKELRALGKELGCPILLLSQLSREESGKDGQRKKRRPELQDLRASGEIEQTADIVMFLYRDSYYEQGSLTAEDDIVEVIVRKHRNGRTGINTLRWIPKYTKFKNL